MNHKLRPSEEFKKSLKRLTTTEQKQTAPKLELLKGNPFHPSLRTKKVRGLDGVFEMSVNMDIRIIGKYESRIILLLIDIGHHKKILGV
jgi:mRNA-degrading endonuclease RelE of RelBE toxin-antitoxin system